MIKVDGAHGKVRAATATKVRSAATQTQRLQSTPMGGPTMKSTSTAKAPI